MMEDRNSSSVEEKVSKDNIDRHDIITPPSQHHPDQNLATAPLDEKPAIVEPEVTRSTLCDDFYVKIALDGVSAADDQHLVTSLENHEKKCESKASLSRPAFLSNVPNFKEWHPSRLLSGGTRYDTSRFKFKSTYNYAIIISAGSVIESAVGKACPSIEDVLKPAIVERTQYLLKRMCLVGLLPRVETKVTSMGVLKLLILISTDDETLGNECRKLELERWIEQGHIGDFNMNKNYHNLSPADRIVLLDQLLHEEYEQGGVGVNDFNDIIERVLPLHDDNFNRNYLLKWYSHWKDFFRNNDDRIELIRLQFGEKTALYFAYMDFYTKWLIPLAMIGVVLYIISYVSARLYFQLCAILGLAICSVWGPMFLVYWNRRKSELGATWGIGEFESKHYLNSRFQGEMRFDKITNSYSLTYPTYKRYLKYLCGYFILIFFVILETILTVAFVDLYFYFKGGCAGSCSKTGFENWLLVLSQGIMLGILIDVVQYQFFRLIADLLTEWENHRTEHRYQTSRATKLFLWDFFGIYSWFWVSAFVYIPYGNEFTSWLNDVNILPWESYFEPGVVDLARIFVTPLVVTQALKIFFEKIVPYFLFRGAYQAAEANGGHLYALYLETQVLKENTMKFVGGATEMFSMFIKYTLKEKLENGSSEGDANSIHKGDDLQTNNDMDEDAQAVEDKDEVIHKLHDDAVHQSAPTRDVEAEFAIASGGDSSPEKGIFSPFEAESPPLSPASTERWASQDINANNKVHQTQRPRSRRHSFALQQIRNQQELKKQRQAYLTRVLEQSLHPPHDTCKDYADTCVQYGYVTQFTCVWPFIPLCSLINNLFEIRASAFQLCYTSSRPLPRRTHSIGVWHKCLRVTNAWAIVINSGLVVYSTGLLEIFDPDCPTPQVSDVNSDRLPPLVPNYSCVGQSSRVWFFLLLEHLCVIAFLCVNAFVASTPSWVVKRREEEDRNLKEKYLEEIGRYEKLREFDPRGRNAKTIESTPHFQEVLKLLDRKILKSKEYIQRNFLSKRCNTLSPRK